jgi:multisubunit Na+/H+ antiporter MnhC subunit
VLKVVGVFLILAAIIALLCYGFYQIILTATIPLWIRFSLTALAIGLLFVLLSLLRERARDIKKEAKEDDLS